MPFRIDRLTGQALANGLDELSLLRLEIFREWPYLYDGDADYEADYLRTFAEAPGTVIVAAYDGGRMVGAATAAPLAGHSDDFVPLFRAHGYDPDKIFYCGESVLLPAYRGQGIGHRFFDEREAHARALNAQGADFRHATFCGVVRPAGDDRMPAGYRPLDGFWRKRGYEPVDGLIGHYDWREPNGDREISHAMQFWMRKL